ncbi:MAG TPA: 2-oxo acid dehydrogenase subunit E2 [Anaerolineae bacterium]|nr:2-oxo acid dehydrogenase subunit E2 [Anaerolineae bacterium]HQI86448.1 2-oxo acid dehydrogenase subunit E2 [Anaerolineae bacterium]
MAIKEIILPMLGETMNDGVIVEWLKAVGEPVMRGETLFSVETDKAVLEVEASADGFLREILTPAGERVPVLAVIARMTDTPDELLESANQQISKSANESISPSLPHAPTPSLSHSPTPPPPASPTRLFASPRARKLAEAEGVDLAEIVGSGPNGRIVEKDVAAYLAAAPKVTPVARRLAESLGVDLRGITGTGPSGRVTKADVEKSASQQISKSANERMSESANQRVSESATQRVSESPPLSISPSPSPSRSPSPTETPMSGVRAIIAQRMHASHVTTAETTLTVEVDATAFAALREKLKARFAKELGFNISYNDLLMVITAKALRKFPAVNARLDEAAGVIRQLDEVNISLAMDTPRGLIVPVVRDVDRKGLLDIARATNDLVQRTRAGKVLPDELTGGTFTITNLGMFDIDAFTPIINLPEIAILGVGRIQEKPAVYNGAICIRKLMWLSLTFDHRLVDGGPAARFMQYIKQLVEDPDLMWV